jgi:hypothetical protein
MSENLKACPFCGGVSEHDAPRIADLEARLEEAEERATIAESRRGGECKTCGKWVCPPLECYGCRPAADHSPLAALKERVWNFVVRATKGDDRGRQLHISFSPETVEEIHAALESALKKGS